MTQLKCFKLSFLCHIDMQPLTYELVFCLVSLITTY